MCWEDVKIGRAAGREEKTVIVGPTAVEIVPQDPNRLSLTLYNLGPQVVTLGFKPDVLDGQGIQLVVTLPALQFNLKDHGQIVTGGIFGVAPAAGQGTVTYWASTVLEKPK